MSLDKKGEDVRPLRCRFLGRLAVHLSNAGRCLASEKRSSGKSRRWFWAGQLGLWGFECGDGFGSDWAGRVRRLRGLSVITGFAGSPTTYVACQRFRQLLRLRAIDLRRFARPRAGVA